MRVYIADDSRLVVERLADLLQEGVPGAQLVGQAGDVPEAVRGIQKMGQTPSFSICKCPEVAVSMFSVPFAQTSRTSMS